VSLPPQPKVGARRHARECALQLLYQLDGVPPAGGESGLVNALAAFWTHSEPEGATNKELVKFAETIIRGTVENFSRVDAAIMQAAQHWKLERMSRVDRNILRLGAWEILFGEVPSGIVINEAIELAKEFGTVESGGFVNGVLDRISELATRKS
jgi:N utilization substance protein B